MKNWINSRNLLRHESAHKLFNSVLNPKSFVFKNVGLFEKESTTTDKRF